MPASRVTRRPKKWATLHQTTARGPTMRIGVTMFATDYAIAPHELAVEAEKRGFESLWFPEHSHIPTSRKSPWPVGGELPRDYWHTYDLFVSLMAAAAATQTIK